MQEIKYIFGVLLMIPFLPVMLASGRRLRRTMVSLAPASGNRGVEGEGSEMARILAIGESTIAGLGARSQQDALVGQVAKNLATHLPKRIQYQVSARTGITAAELHVDHLGEIGEPWDLIIVGLGGNDTFRLTTPWRWKRNIRDLLLSIRIYSPEVPIVFIHTPPAEEFILFTRLLKFFLGHHVRILAAALDDTIQDFPSVYFCADQISIYKWMAEHDESLLPGDFFSDGVHPSELTYRLWAKDVARNILDWNLL